MTRKQIVAAAALAGIMSGISLGNLNVRADDHGTEKCDPAKDKDCKDTCKKDGHDSCGGKTEHKK